MNATPTDATRLPVVDGFRAIAIVLVLFANSTITGYRPEIVFGDARIGSDWLVYGGTLGVSLFFFISGFVLFVPYARAKISNGRAPSLRHFADRRFIKIVPSYYFALFVQAALFTLGSDVDADRVHQLATHAFFVQSFDGRTIAGIDGAFWTLATEVQFYALFPLIAYAMIRKPTTTFAIILALAVGYRRWLHVLGRDTDALWVAQLPAQLDTFAVGMLAAFAYVVLASRTRHAFTANVATAVALVASAVGIALLASLSSANGSSGEQQLWQNDHRIVVAFTIAALVLGSLFAAPAWQRLLSLPPLLWLSGISYNLYLWHEAVLMQCSHTGFPCAGRLAPWTSLDGWNRQYFFSYVIVSLAVAWLLTHALERPLLALGTRGALQWFVAGFRQRSTKKPAEAGRS